MVTVILFGSIIFLFIVFFYLFCIQPHRYWINKGVPQGKSVWMFGEIWKVIIRKESFAESIQRMYKKFPSARFMGTYQFNTPLFVVRDPELIKLITIKDFEHFLDHRMWVPETSDPLWTHNLFSLQGEKWKEMRTFLSPAFTGKKMRTMFVLMKDAAENFIQHFKNKNEDLIELDFKDTFNRFTCDVVATTAFGVEVNSLKNRDNEFYNISHEAGDFTGLKMAVFYVSLFLPEFLIKLLNVRVFSKRVCNFFIELVNDTIKIREEKNIVRPDMIHLMMEARKGKHEFDVIEDENTDAGFASSKISYASSKPKQTKMTITNTEIAAQGLIFIVGGMDTVSTLMRFLTYELAKNPEIQNKARNEISKTLDICNNEITYDALQKMKYMDMVVSECLRKWPSALAIERICTKPYTIPPLHPEEKEITLEKGTLVWIPTMGIHYDPQYYPNPDKFDPERFNDDNKAKINPYVFIPFGQGPRNCIGNRFAILEAKVILFYILKSFEIVPVSKSKIPISLVKNTFNLDGDCFIFGLKKLN